jgi:aryl-phospho-beta-D-glucosidase BglC (GH1 family)
MKNKIYENLLQFFDLILQENVRLILHTYFNKGSRRTKFSDKESTFRIRNTGSKSLKFQCGSSKKIWANHFKNLMQIRKNNF